MIPIAVLSSDWNRTYGVRQSMSQPIVVTTTCDRIDILDSISIELVKKRLAACCQISGPVTSIYRWEGKLEQTQEWVCSIRTASTRLAQVISAIKQIHSYDEPEITATEISGGSDSYLRWVESEVSSDSGDALP